MMSHKGRIAILTLGCKVNQVDSDSLAGAFRERGYEIVDFDDLAEVYIVNTCTVTNLADRKSRQMLRRAVRSNPNALVVATGCFAQTEGANIAEEIPGVGLVLGTRGRTNLVDLVEQSLASKPENAVSAVTEYGTSDDYEEFPSPSLTGRTRASIKVQEGCDNFCAYCKIPYARGPVRSRTLDNTLDEVRQLAGMGYKEIVLTGVHLGHYGKEWHYSKTIADVVEAVSEVDGIARVRLSSIDPIDVSKALIKLVAQNPKVCRHLHMPLQGGHDVTLKAMNRKYSLTDYRGIVGEIRDYCPDIALTTDVIVGFPGENIEHFNSTLAFVEEIGFSKMHVFPYSIRTGTPAADYPNQVTRVEKERRAHVLIELGRELSRKYHETLVGSKVEVLIEQCDAAGRRVEGLTDTYVRVTASAQEISESLVNEFATVVINRADFLGADGVILKDFC